MSTELTQDDVVRLKLALEKVGLDLGPEVTPENAVSRIEAVCDHRAFIAHAGLPTITHTPPPPDRPYPWPSAAR